eukprot:1915131-Rhodomonas_salina.1
MLLRCTPYAPTLNHPMILRCQMLCSCAPYYYAPTRSPHTDLVVPSTRRVVLTKAIQLRYVPTNMFCGTGVEVMLMAWSYAVCGVRGVVPRAARRTTRGTTAPYLPMPWLRRPGTDLARECLSPSVSATPCPTSKILLDPTLDTNAVAERVGSLSLYTPASTSYCLSLYALAITNGVRPTLVSYLRLPTALHACSYYFPATCAVATVSSYAFAVSLRYHPMLSPCP